MRIIALGAALALFFGWLAASDPTPQTSLVSAGEIDECSGIVHGRLNQDLLYVHNDSGGQPIVFALDDKGVLKHRLVLEGVRNRDWEDIAIGPGPNSEKTYIYVGEIGDNNARYSSVYVYRFEEPQLSLADTLVSINEVDSLEIRYEDGARDAEALIVDPRSGDILIISKREAEVGAYMVSYPQSTTEPNMARKVATLPLTWVTAADISPNGRSLLVKTYTSVYRFKRSRRQSLAGALQHKMKALPYVVEPQGEAICFDAKGKGRFTLSERSGDTELFLYRYKK